MDTSEPEAAHRAVLELATAPGPEPRAGLAYGGTGQAAADRDPAADGDGEAWRAQDVLAHLVVNHRLLAPAVRSVLDGAAQPYDNADAIELARPPARVVDGDETRVDQPLPVAGLLTIQARTHRPMHERQLGELLGRAVIAARRPWVSTRHVTGACLGRRPGRPGGYQIGMRKLPAKGCKII
jgi:hypothetical protein